MTGRIARCALLALALTLGPAPGVARAGKGAEQMGEKAWTAQTVAVETKRFAAALRQLGMKAPMARARELAGMEQDWSAAAQTRWRSRIWFWRGVLLGEGKGYGWPELVDLDRPELADIRDDLAARGDRAEAAWAGYMRTRRGLREHMGDRAFRELVLMSETWGLYGEDGEFDFSRAEDLVAGKVRLLGMDPVTVDPEADYSYLVQHPRDRAYQIMHQNNWAWIALALAQYHAPADERWARQFVRMLAAHVDQCPRLPEGLNDFGKGPFPGRAANCAWVSRGYAGNRLQTTLMIYMLMKDSPALADRVHAVVLRYARAHAVHMHELGPAAYRDNYLIQVGKGLFMARALLPELRDSGAWAERMWPNLIRGMERELLDDGTHMHRAYSYHSLFVRNPVAMILLARRLGIDEGVPKRFRELAEAATRSLAVACAPTRMSPGINDDSTAGVVEWHEVFRLAAEALERPEWLYLATDGREGAPPVERSVLLPAAQLVAMRSDWSRQARYLFFNISPNGGHHHPDTLSVQVWSGGRRLLTEPGCGHYYTGEREVSKRSWWHSTPTLGASMIPDRCRPEVLHWETSDDLDYAVGRIEAARPDGTAPVRFVRHVFFVGRAFWLICDRFENVPEGRAVWENFFFPNQLVELAEDGRSILTTYPNGANLRIEVHSPGWTPRREDALVWTVYGAKPDPAVAVHLEADAATAAQGFVALLVPIGEGSAGVKPTVKSATPRDDGSLEVVVEVGKARRKLVTHVGK